jgi:hypothetical protein
MTLICVTGHQGTGKSTLMNEVRNRGYLTYGLDEEKIAGYFDIERNTPSLIIPTGLDRNLEWRKSNVWKANLDKLNALKFAPDSEPTFIFGNAVNIEEIWQSSAAVIVLQLDDDTTRHRLINRTNNMFGKHPGEIELALKTSQVISNKAKAHSSSNVHYLDSSSDVSELATAIINIGIKSSILVH